MANFFLKALLFNKYQNTNRSMTKKLSAFFGLFLLFFSAYFFLGIKNSEKKAQSRDTKKTIFAIVGDETPPACKWTLETPQRVMSENSSQAIIVRTSNTAKKICEAYLSLRAPGFEVDPSKDEQKITLKSDSKGSVSWIISPHKTGNYDIALSDILNTKTFGISVTNMFGLNAFQAKIFSLIGSIFGPMFTIPWWWDRLKKRKDTK